MFTLKHIQVFPNSFLWRLGDNIPSPCVSDQGHFMVHLYLVQLLSSHANFSVPSFHTTSSWCPHQHPPPLVSTVCHYLKPKNKLSRGASDGIYGGRWEQRSEVRIADPKQTNRLRALPWITVTRRASGTRKKLITLRAHVESPQVLKCHKFEQWVCQCQLNKQRVIQHQLLGALLWAGSCLAQSPSITHHFETL